MPISYLEKTLNSKLLEQCAIRLSPRLLSYRPFQIIQMETTNYILKTAQTIEELLKVFELRYQIFLQNKSGGKKINYDIDEFDHLCDHLIIIDKNSDNIIGTYRVFCSNRSNTFYSANEFQLTSLLNQSGVKLELGRACIHPDFRNGSIIDLLWNGIAQYIKKTNAHYLFGCTSIYTTSPREAFSLYQYMKDKNWANNKFEIKPTDLYRIKLQRADHISHSFFNPGENIPPLLKSYIAAGAKISSPPALDQEFECIDFLTILEMTNLSSLFKRRYFKQ